MSGLRSSAALPVLACTLALPVLLAGMPPDGFFVGDAGVKIIAAREAARHPGRPFEVDPPLIGDVAGGEYMDPFFVVHRGHAHATTSLLFPAVTAPFIAMFGIYGAYVLPALSLLGLAWVMVALARRLEIGGNPALAGWAVALLSPVLFYSLECWEHAPAVLAVALAIFVAMGNGRSGPLFAGVAMGIAILLRPEAIWSALGLATSMTRGGRGVSVARISAFVAAVAATLAPVAVFNLSHFGSPWGIHVTANVGLLERGWWESRVEIGRLWFFSWRRESLLAVFPIAVLALVSLRRHRLWPLVLVPLVGVLLSAPNDGGGQWGPRYLLAIVPPVLLLAQDAGVRLLERCRNRTWWVATMLIAILVIAGLAATRASYRSLRGSKRIHAQVAREMASLGSSHVVTDLWWLDQLAAARPYPTFLYVADADRVSQVVRLFGEQQIERFAVVTADDSPAFAWPSGWAGPFVAVSERSTRERRLRITSYALSKN